LYAIFYIVIHIYILCINLYTQGKDISRIWHLFFL